MDTQDPTASGLCSISPRSRRSEPAACNDQACFRSPQSMPTIAVNLGSWGELASLIRETSFFSRQAPCFRERHYSRVLIVSGPHLRIRFGNKAAPAARDTNLRHRMSAHGTRRSGRACCPIMILRGVRGNPLDNPKPGGGQVRPRSLYSTERGKGAQTPPPCPAPPIPRSRRSVHRTLATSPDRSHGVTISPRREPWEACDIGQAPERGGRAWRRYVPTPPGTSPRTLLSHGSPHAMGYSLPPSGCGITLA
jgi:hypothetical protein